jgi:hypothetical protein
MSLRPEIEAAVADLYAQSVRPLPVAARLRPATLILAGIPLEAVDDFSEEWTEEDVQDLTRHALTQAGNRFGDVGRACGASSERCW